MYLFHRNLTPNSRVHCNCCMLLIVFIFLNFFWLYWFFLYFLWSVSCHSLILLSFERKVLIYTYFKCKLLDRYGIWIQGILNNWIDNIHHCSGKKNAQLPSPLRQRLNHSSVVFHPQIAPCQLWCDREPIRYPTSEMWQGTSGERDCAGEGKAQTDS